jgi:hypothetical protein
MISYKTLSTLVVGLAAASAVQAADKKITRAELPAAVEKTVAEQSKGAKSKMAKNSTRRNSRSMDMDETSPSTRAAASWRSKRKSRSRRCRPR